MHVVTTSGERKPCFASQKKEKPSDVLLGSEIGKSSCVKTSHATSKDSATFQLSAKNLICQPLHKRKRRQTTCEIFDGFFENNEFFRALPRNTRARELAKRIGRSCARLRRASPRETHPLKITCCFFHSNNIVYSALWTVQKATALSNASRNKVDTTLNPALGTLLTTPILKFKVPSNGNADRDHF